MSTLENYGNGIVSVCLDPEAAWARTTAPHALLVIDWDEDHNPYTITFAGPLARAVLAEGPTAALELARKIGDDAEVTVDGLRAWDPDELNTVEHALTAVRDAIPAS